MTTLHGTELKFLHGAIQRKRISDSLGLSFMELARIFPEDSTQEQRHQSLARLPDWRELDEEDLQVILGTRWTQWTHSNLWIDRIRSYASASAKVSVISEHDLALAHQLLGIPESKIQIIPNGVDTETFQPSLISDDERYRILHKWLVEDPQGWRPGRPPGSICYETSDIRRIFNGHSQGKRPILLWMGRFLGFKRLDILLRSIAELRRESDANPVVVVLGGFPGEWEGPHPYTLVESLGIADDVYFAGWRGHEELIDALHCSDLLAAPSVDEPFGLIYLEAMAAGIPVVATASGGPLGYVKTCGESANGWLASPGDQRDLTRILLDAIAKPQELARRGRNAREFVERSYSWRSIADQYMGFYGSAL
ncbi:glycosyltransferase family 4 protein [Streptomyces sp. NPDC051658]|uniref:glycosyltransferase family 4 protein n=1 Tax=Streptomyces sp. NPDC051658 TaxID=3365667 RepID=UPI0037A68A26